MTHRVYIPAGPIIAAFHRSKAFFRGIRGPIGSGKTVACCYELLHMAQQQEPSPLDGWRRTRWLVVRNTYRELETSTIPTWNSQFPENVFGRFKRSPPFRHLIRDKSQKFEMDVHFLALDNEDNVRDLLSTEWSGAFINEARELPKGLVDNIVSRLRRYPEMAHGGPTRPGLVADTNAPGADHWWPILSGDMPPPEHFSEEDRRLYVKPKGWEFFTQPPAVHEIKKDGSVIGYEVNPEAENLTNLHPDYYSEQYHGKERDWIAVYLLNRYRDVRSGKPIYPQFSQETHVYKKEQAPGVSGKGRFGVSAYKETFIGLDFGLTPAAAVLQRSPVGRYRILREFVTTNMTIPEFAEWLPKQLATIGLEPDNYQAYGDPSGDDRDEQGDTAIQLMAAGGMTVWPAPTNEFSVRVGAVAGLLTRLVNGHPALMVNPSCRYLIKGFVSGYHYRRLRVVGEHYEEKPNKRVIYCHIHDALQYAALGAGEGRKLLGAREGKVVTKSRAERNFDVWGRERSSSWGERRGGVKRWR